MRTATVTPGGVPGLGDVPWGSHFCHFYDSGEDLGDTLVPFFKAGLDQHEACLWVTSDPFPATVARHALAAVVPDLDRREAEGQIEIIDHEDWYLRTGTQDAEQTLRGWIDHQEQALASGYRGLRLTGNTYWLEREDWESFVAYEALVNESFGRHRIVAMCSYCLDRSGSRDVLDVVRNHQFALVRRGETWDVLESSALRATRDDLLRVQTAMEREQEITRQLRNAEARYRESDRRKDEFLAMLGHELRNPMAPILTALQLLRLRGADAQYRKEHDVIERQVRHLSSLVDDLLDVSRITRGKLELKPERMELCRAVAAGIEIASPLLEQYRHVLHVDVPAVGLFVDAEPQRLAQVVANLLSNAAKHTPAGGDIAVTAALEGSAVVLRVRDTGPGIAPELLPDIFELFVQGDQSIERGAGGLGLGLAIVRSLVELHGGTVTVESSRSAGSTFTVALPVVETPRHPDGECTAATRPGLTPHATRVLVVDDNEDAVSMLAELLRMWGFDVRTAPDGPTALAVAVDFGPEIALLDIGLPVMDGYELAGRLRTLPGRKAARLIAVTGYGQDSDRERAEEAGFAEHVAKPVSAERLREVLGV